MDNIELFEDLPPEQSKKVAVMVGRLSVPTAGHYKVISKMKQFIRENPKLNLEVKPIIVIVAGEKTSKDKSKNPLTVDERISFMQASGKANGVIFLTAKDGFTALGVVRDNGYEPIAIGAGSDRIDFYLDNLDKNFTKKDGSKIKHYVIPGLDRTDDAKISKKTDKENATDKTLKKMKKDGDLDVEEISSSVARRAVELGYKEEFATIVGLEHKPVLANKMFHKIALAMGVQQ